MATLVYILQHDQHDEAGCKMASLFVLPLEVPPSLLGLDHSRGAGDGHMGIA